MSRQKGGANSLLAWELPLRSRERKRGVIGSALKKGFVCREHAMSSVDELAYGRVTRSDDADVVLRADIMRLKRQLHRRGAEVRELRAELAKQRDMATKTRRELVDMQQRVPEVRDGAEAGTERQPTVAGKLHQRCEHLRALLAARDATISTLRREAKHTRICELETERDEYFNEVARLRLELGDVRSEMAARKMMAKVTSKATARRVGGRRGGGAAVDDLDDLSTLFRAQVLNGHDSRPVTVPGADVVKLLHSGDDATQFIEWFSPKVLHVHDDSSQHAPRDLTGGDAWAAGADVVNLLHSGAGAKHFIEWFSTNLFTVHSDASCLPRDGAGSDASAGVGAGAGSQATAWAETRVADAASEKNAEADQYRRKCEARRARAVARRARFLSAREARLVELRSACVQHGVPYRDRVFSAAKRIAAAIKVQAVSRGFLARETMVRVRRFASGAQPHGEAVEIAIPRDLLAPGDSKLDLNPEPELDPEPEHKLEPATPPAKLEDSAEEGSAAAAETGAAAAADEGTTEEPSAAASDDAKAAAADEADEGGGGAADADSEVERAAAAETGATAAADEGTTEKPSAAAGGDAEIELEVQHVVPAEGEGREHDHERQATLTTTDASLLVERRKSLAEGKVEVKRRASQIEEEQQRLDKMKKQLAKAEADHASATTGESKLGPGKQTGTEAATEAWKEAEAHTQAEAEAGKEADEEIGKVAVTGSGTKAAKETEKDEDEEAGEDVGTAADKKTGKR